MYERAAMSEYPGGDSGPTGLSQIVLANVRLHVSFEMEFAVSGKVLDAQGDSALASVDDVKRILGDLDETNLLDILALRPTRVRRCRCPEILTSSARRVAQERRWRYCGDSDGRRG